MSSLISMITEATCGEGCWHAKEEVCRCSCGGRNHGILNTPDGSQPVRTCKLDGMRYELRAIGNHNDLLKEADKINRFMPDGVTKRYSRIEKAERWGEYREEGAEYHQYTYTWRETDKHAPARLKYATRVQVNNWPELSHYQNSEEIDMWEYRNLSLLWVRVELPPQASGQLVDKAGQPIPFPTVN